MAENINITYDLLFDILRYEKSRDDLQPIDKNFFSNVVDYLKIKEELLINHQTPVTERELTRIQLNNVKKLLSEIYERREKKIINLALYKIRTNSEIINNSAMLDDEKILFDSIFLVLNKYRQSILNNILDSKLPFAEPAIFDSGMKTAAQSSAESLKKTEQDEDSLDYVKSVRFIKPVPRFLGPELENYGPFEEQDIASLPSKIANVLIRKVRAEEIRTE